MNFFNSNLFVGSMLKTSRLWLDFFYFFSVILTWS